jgi:integrase
VAAARGHIKARRNGFAVIVNYGRDPVTGKRRQVWRSAATKDEAERLRTRLLAERDGGGFAVDGKATLKTFLTGWLESRIASGELAESTAEVYTLIVNRRIIPVLGNVRLRDLTPAHVERLKVEEADAGRSTKSALNTFRLLDQAIRGAVHLGLISVNPCVRVRAPRPRRYTATIPTTAQLSEILDAADAEGGSIGPLCRLAAWTGARQGELINLRWTNVDSERRRLTLPGTKTRASARVIDIGPDACELLRSHRQAQKERGLLLGAPALFGGDGAYVFTSQVGSRLERHNLQRTWSRILKTAKVTEHVRFHDLRHAAASLMIGAGLPIVAVSAMLGHSRVSTTLDVYAHLMPGQGEEAALLLEDLIAGRRRVSR